MSTPQQFQLVARPPIHPTSFDKLDPQRHDHIYLYVEGEGANDQGDDTVATSNSKRQYPRYTLTVIDRSGSASTMTAVFLIPAGREAEYMFTHGLSVIAESANTSRLIAVALGRHDVFHSPQQIQDELAYVCQVLHRGGRFANSGSNSDDGSSPSPSIPFLALSGVGEREILVQGTSALSGPYVIEQVPVDDMNNKSTDDDDERTVVVRRLYFLNNPFVIQSEVHYYYDRQRGKGEEDGANSEALLVVDPSRAFDYHKTIVAGLAALSSSNSTTAPAESVYTSNDIVATATTPPKAGLLLGLGGGGLIHYLHWVLSPDEASSSSTQWSAIELDPEVAMLARNHFGVERHVQSGFLQQIHIGNGLHVNVTSSEQDDDLSTPALSESEASSDGSGIRFAPGSLAFVVIDVDSKDTTVGMSCPPQEFVDMEYLTRLSTLLGDSGILTVNVSARDPKLLDHACRNIHTVFPNILVSNHDDDCINVVVFASKKELSRRELGSSAPVSCREELQEIVNDLVVWKPSNPQAITFKNGKKNKKKKGKKK